MKKLILLILSIFVLGQSFVFADIIDPNETPQQYEARIAARQKEVKDCEDAGNTRKILGGPAGYCVKNENQQKNYIIGTILIVCLAGGIFLYLRNRKNHTDDKPLS